MERLGKKIVFTALAFIIVISAICSTLLSSASVLASKRSSEIFSENFTEATLSESKWIDVDNSEGEVEADKIAPFITGGGTLNLTWNGAWGGSHVIYYDKEIAVADDEDLVIEYSVAGFDYGDIFETTGTNAYIGLVKGLDTLAPTISGASKSSVTIEIKNKQFDEYAWYPTTDKAKEAWSYLICISWEEVVV